MVPSAEVLELPTLRGRDDDVAGVRAAQSGRRTGDCVGLVEDRGVALEAHHARALDEPQLGAFPARDDRIVLDEQHHAGRRLAVQALGEDAGTRCAGAEAVYVCGAVGRGDEGLRRMAEPLAEPRDVADRRLPVIGHDEHCVPLDERVQTARGPDETPDRVVAAREHRVGSVRAGGVGRIVVVREVEEQEVEAVARHEPAADGGGVGVDRPRRAVAEREWRARPLALEEVVEEEPLRPEHRPEERDRRPVAGAPAVGGEVDGRSPDSRVCKRLEDRHRLPAEVVGVHPHERVAERPAQPGSACRAEGRAVLDESSLLAVPPHEVGDLVDVRVRPRRDRG